MSLTTGWIVLSGLVLLMAAVLFVWNLVQFRFKRFFFWSFMLIVLVFFGKVMDRQLDLVAWGKGQPLGNFVGMLWENDRLILQCTQGSFELEGQDNAVLGYNLGGVDLRVIQHNGQIKVCYWDGGLCCL